MPDRAVCKEDDCGSTVYAVDWCWEHYRINRLGGVSKPRAVVALSDDRQWLVVLTPQGHWDVLGQGYAYYRNSVWVSLNSSADTGQDAHEVLREWMEGRDA